MLTQDGEVRWVGPHVVVTMPAEMDAVNADEVRHALLAAASLGAAVLVIDMSGTTFCDSAGVGAIIATYQHIKQTRTQLRLVATAVVRILTLAGADKLIPIYPTLAAALAGPPAAEASPR